MNTKSRFPPEMEIRGFERIATIIMGRENLTYYISIPPTYLLCTLYYNCINRTLQNHFYIKNEMNTRKTQNKENNNIKNKTKTK